jgi:hypothetical protein
VNPNIQKIIDATPKGEGGKWISIHQAELMITQVVLECASIGERYADGNYEVYNQITAHFGVEQ